MIESLAYCAPLVYSPRGESDIAKKSRAVRDALKGGDKQLIPAMATHVRELVDSGKISGFFGSDVTLVPVPRSAPAKPESLWVPLMIARALKDIGLAQEVWPCLTRAKAVQKSAWAVPGERPTLDQHIASLKLTEFLAPTGRILLIDDFITKGRTLLAAAITITNGIHGLDLKAFACIRTLGLVPDIERLRDPTVGSVTVVNGDAFRNP